MRNCPKQNKQMPDGMIIHFMTLHIKINANAITNTTCNDPCKYWSWDGIEQWLDNKNHHPTHGYVQNQREYLEAVDVEYLQNGGHYNNGPHNRKEYHSGILF